MIGRDRLVKFLEVRTPKTLDLALITRGLAALAVVWWHAGGNHTTNEAAFPFVPSGRMAVWLFFVLSGYMIGSGFFSGRYTYSFKSLRNFFANRWLRIYPIFFVVLVACYFIHLGLSDIPSQDIWIFLREATLSKWNHEYKLNGVFWTLGIEIQFYLFAPLLLFFQVRSKRQIPIASLLYIAFLIGAKYLDELPGESIDCRNLAGNLMHFQTGILLCALRPKILALPRKWKTGLTKVLPVFAIAALLVSNNLFFVHNTEFLKANGMLLVDFLGASVLVLHIIVEERRRPVHFMGKLLLVLGAFSYGLYAWHGALGIYPSLETNFWVQLPLALALTYLSYLIVEKPVQGLKRS